MLAAAKLVHLFEVFSAPRFLFARPGNAAFVAQLLETLNNALQYQYEGNSPLVYCVLRRHALFERLRDVLPSTVAAAAAAGGGAGDAASAAGGARGRPRPSDASSSAADEAARVHAAAETAAAAGAAGAPPLSSGGPSAVGADGAAPGSGGWVASDAWWRQERASLPLGTVLRLISYLRPRVEAMIAGTDGGVEDTAVSPA